MKRLAPVLVVLAAAVPYLRTVADYFVQDDFGGMQLLAAKPWYTFARWFTMPWMEFIWGYTPDEIRPFTALSYQISDLGRASLTEGHHALNIAVHAANGLLALGIARQAAGLTRPGATIAALAFVLLPMGAESVAWITGRVDSLPAFFYLISFYTYVLWRRREPAAPRLYLWSLGWFFAALFSKQNTITMTAALVAFDWLVLRRPVRPSWQWLRPYLPFALLTLGFLVLRYVLIGEALRESQLSANRFAELGGILTRHLQRMIWGDLGRVADAVKVFALLYGLAALAGFARAESAVRDRALRSALYFGVVWIALGLAPTVAAGYESPRHAYLAAVGWATLIGLSFDLLQRAAAGLAGSSPRAARTWARIAGAAVVAILALYAVRLHREVTDWRLRAAVAHRALVELERQIPAAPEDTLFLVGVPVPSWEWAVPYVLRPPYAGSDLTARANIVTPVRLHCCRGKYWDAATRTAIERWRKSGAPAVAVYVSPDGEIKKLTDAEEPDLRTLISTLMTIPSTDTLDGAIQDILRKLVAGRGRVVSEPLAGRAARS